jgi:hypothetical protein
MEAKANAKADKYLAKSGQAEPVSGRTDKLGQAEPVSKGGRGKRSPVKEQALNINEALPKEDRVSESSLKRAIAKAEGREPTYTARPMPKPRSGKPVVGIEAVRRHYLDLCADPEVDLDAEHVLILDGFKEIVGRRNKNREIEASISRSSRAKRGG